MVRLMLSWIFITLYIIIKEVIKIERSHCIETYIGFLCPLASNVYGLEFLEFTIRDGDTKKKLFEITKERVYNSIATAKASGAKSFSKSDPDNYRKIAYGTIV